jgi:hypothetical protein
MSMMIMSSTFELIWLSSTSFVTKDVDDDDEFGIGTHLTFIYIFHLLQFIVPKTVRPVAPPVKVLADMYVDFRADTSVDTCCATSLEQSAINSRIDSFEKKLSKWCTRH